MDYVAMLAYFDKQFAAGEITSLEFRTRVSDLVKDQNAAITEWRNRYFSIIEG